jgi:hypothetical protein
VTDFDIVATHTELETYERRIRNGTDQDHRHPAQVIAASDDGPFVPARDEAARGDHYELAPTTDRVPAFWPPRVWDTPDTAMSPEETETMVGVLSEQQAAIGTVAPARPPRVASSGPAPRKHPRKTTVVILRTETYVTDQSEGETDWDEF